MFKASRKFIGYNTGHNNTMKNNNKNQHIERKFECTGNGSSKFWNVIMNVDHYNGFYTADFKYGKIGTTGASTTSDYYNAKEMNKVVEKKIAEKLAKGYVEVGTFPVPANGILAPPPITKYELKELKKLVKDVTRDVGVDISGYLRSGQEYEIIVTVMTGGEVIQETVKNE